MFGLVINRLLGPSLGEPCDAGAPPRSRYARGAISKVMLDQFRAMNEACARLGILGHTNDRWGQEISQALDLATSSR